MGSRLLAPTLAFVALGAYLAAELYVIGRLGFPLDDSWIHLQFASRLAMGDGLAYNPGEWVAGSSSPLWTALLALGFLGPAPWPMLWPKILGCLGLFATVAASDALAGEIGLSDGWRRLSGVLVATSHWLLWSALSGMEITLFMALSLWGLVLHAREDRRGSGDASIAVLALACLARPEGLLLLALGLASKHLRLSEARDGDRTLTLLLAGWRPWIYALVAVGPVMLFFSWLDGSPAPTTLSAKVRPDLLPSGAYLRLVLDVFWRSQPALVLLALGGVLHAFKTLRRGALLPAFWLFGLPFAYSLLASPARPMPLGNFGRYYLPLLPLVIVFGLLALAPMLDAWRSGLGFLDRRLPIRGVVIGLLLVPHLSLLIAGPGRYVQTVANVEDSDVKAARWLQPRLPEGALLAVQDVGALKFLLPNPVIDLAGLVSPEVQTVLEGDDEVYWEERLARFLAEKRPDYLVVFRSSYPAITSSDGFNPLISFTVENNVTMAGNELLVLSTPWTDQPLAEP